jgi:predicted nucleotidyltransferase
MYHGTDVSFNSFGKEHIGRHGSYEGYGFNFTPCYTRAESYNSNNVIEAYLRAEHPMTTKTHKLTPAKIAKVIAEIDKGVPYTNTIVAAFESPRYRENWDAMYYRRALPVAARYIYNTSRDDETGDAGTYASICLCGNGDVYKVISAFEKLGYDSVIHYSNNGNINTVIVFEANQIKLVGNKTYNNDSELMGENIEPEVSSSDVDLSSFKKRDTLPPGIWKDEETLDSRVRLKLLDIAQDFIEFLDVSWVKPEDTIVVGSIANYNWSKYSDIDLHVVIDYTKVDERKKFVENYFQSKKKEWNDTHDEISIFGYPVELYVQDKDADNASSAVYSLDKNKWIKKPERDVFTKKDIDSQAIKKKASSIMTDIEDLEKKTGSADGDEYKNRKLYDDTSDLIDDITSKRKTSLSKTKDEMNTDNLVFKVLRRNGYLDKLFNLRDKTYDKMNSIE